jgi:topoisomerase-4 subunit A
MIRITRFDTIKAEELLKETENKIEEVKNHLSNITEYTIEYFKNLKKKYGHLFPRRTESKQLESIDASQVIVANTKLYIDRKEGFIGTGLKKDEFLFECSDLDEIIAFTRSGKMKVVKVAEKVFIGKDIIHAAVFKRNDEKTVYHMIYRDGPKGITFMKKFNVTGVTRDKEYDLTKGTEGSVVYWFSANPNGENEKVIVHLRQVPGLRKTEIEVDFASMEIKGRQAVGNIVTKNTVNKVTLKEKSGGTVQQTHIWFDDATHRLNTEERGTYLGAFSGDDKILTVTSKGYYKLYSYDLINHFDEDLILIEKYYPQNMISCVYYDGESKQYYAKRFLPENTSSKTLIISEHPESHIEIITSQTHPKIQISYAKEKGKELPSETIILESEAPIVGMKAKGKKIGKGKIKEIQLLEPEEIQDAKKFLENFEDDKGLSPVELYKKALEKLNPDNARDFLDTGNVGDGQMKLDF